MIGIDIVEINRLEKLITKYGMKFLDRIFTKDEIEYCENNPIHKYARYAGRFVAKEAVAKALGQGIREISFKEIEVVKDEFGKPDIELHGRAASLANYMKVVDIYICISHCREYAVGNALLEYEFDEEDFDQGGDVEIFYNDEDENEDNESNN